MLVEGLADESPALVPSPSVPCPSGPGSPFPLGEG